MALSSHGFFRFWVARLSLALSLALAALLGAWQASAPSVLGQARAAEPRSVAVYPPERIALRMDHSHPAHRELACTRCHAEASTSDAASDFLIPRERSCLPCHAAQTDRDEQRPDTCGVCHVGFTGRAPDAAASALVAESRFPQARLRFSHRAHGSATCESCHRGVRDARVATRSHLPTMRQCLSCHHVAGLSAGTEGRDATCATCHLSTPSGQLRTHYPEGDLTPPAWMAGMEHDHEWLVRHRWVGADSGPMCAQCHTESECADCHDGRVRSLRVHPGDFLTTHPAMARRDEPRCTSCHATARFCTECHTRLGLSPMAAPDVRTSQRYHPPTGVWVRGPNMHAREAIRSLASCASCHGESDCVTCHAAPGLGAGISPHPPGFATRCAEALSMGARACVTCHGDLDELRARCR